MKAMGRSLRTTVRPRWPQPDPVASLTTNEGTYPMKNIALAVAALGLAACSATTQCVQPDPVEPADLSAEGKATCWNQGANCGQPLESVNQ